MVGTTFGVDLSMMWNILYCLWLKLKTLFPTPIRALPGTRRPFGLCRYPPVETEAGYCWLFARSSLFWSKKSRPQGLITYRARFENRGVTSTNYLQTSVRIERIIPRLNFRRAVKDYPPLFSEKSRDLPLRLLRYWMKRSPFVFYTRLQTYFPSVIRLHSPTTCVLVLLEHCF